MRVSRELALYMAASVTSKSEPRKRKHTLPIEAFFGKRTKSGILLV